MFLHLGAHLVVSLREVVAILDARTVEQSESTQEFLGLMRSRNRVQQVPEGPEKSYVICSDRVYLSPISAETLRRRVGVLDDLELAR